MTLVIWGSEFQTEAALQGPPVRSTGASGAGLRPIHIRNPRKESRVKKFGDFPSSECENQNYQPHPHSGAPLYEKYVEGSVRPIYMHRPGKYVVPGPG